MIDGFGHLPIKELTSLLTAVGFSSPPSWIKPYHVLSTGERFRCDLARALADAMAQQADANEAEATQASGGRQPPGSVAAGDDVADANEIGMPSEPHQGADAPRSPDDCGAASTDIPPLSRRLAWLLLAACPSVLLLATTNHVCQAVAVIPFLWARLRGRDPDSKAGDCGNKCSC